MSRLVSGELKVFLDSGEVRRVTYFDEPDGVYFDLGKVPEKELRSENFNWQPERKPKSPLDMLEERHPAFFKENFAPDASENQGIKNSNAEMLAPFSIRK